MNKKQLTDTIGQVIRDLELAEKRVLELEDEVARLKEMLPVVDWTNAPNWARWCAVDNSGTCFWYELKPEYSSINGWCTSGELMINNTFMSHYAPHPLQRRPTRKDGNNE